MTGGARLQALLDEGVAAGVFPCAAAVVLHEDRRLFEGAAGGATLHTVVLVKADLRDAKLPRTMIRCVFQEALLRSPDLKGSDLAGARLDDADISGADLRFADLRNIEWKQLKNVATANIAGVKNAPEGFVQWALKNGAVQTPSDDR